MTSFELHTHIKKEQFHWPMCIMCAIYKTTHSFTLRKLKKLYVPKLAVPVICVEVRSNFIIKVTVVILAVKE